MCAVADLPPGQRKIVTVDGRSIGVFNVHGRYYALRNLCPHRRAPLCLGRVRGLVTSDGTLRPIEVQPAGAKRMPWDAYVRGHPAIVGARIIPPS